MSVIEADEPLAVWCMQCECIGEAMWPLLCRLDASDLEFDPVAIFEMMDTPVEGQQKLKTIVGFSIDHFISRDDIIRPCGPVKVTAC
jgi:hypothetical protein